MLNLMFKEPVLFLIFLFTLAISIAVHEFSHALVADRLGDPTPRARGRLTLNPLVHLDPMGLFFILIAGFGWGKPVPYDPFNLKNPDRDGAKIALAGPLSSLALAFLGALGVKLLAGTILSSILAYVVLLNVYLAVFNLIPIHPLDGFQAVAGFLPEDQREDWNRLKRLGLPLLLFLILPLVNGQSVISTFIQPLVGFILNFLIPTGSIL